MLHGIFSAVQAAQYVNTLSAKERGVMISAAKASSGNVLLCEGVGDVGTLPEKNRG